MNEINNKMIFSPSKNAAFRVIADEAVIVNTSSNRLLTLNETGTKIWSCLDGNNIDSIADLLCNEFEVNKEKAINDVEIFLDKLLEHGLIEVKKS